REGEIALVAQGGDRGRRPGRAQVIRRIGRVDVPASVIEALMLDRGLAREFSSSVRREASDVARSDPHAARRRDLTALPTFTIDPVSARDYDDAISAQRDGDRLRLFVHIADVSAFVREGSALDGEARRRTTSVYVPGAVEPMLPHELSSHACSLRPGQDRLAVTVELVLAGEHVSGASFHRSLIRSDARLHYDEVDAIFAGASNPRGEWVHALALARQAALTLGAARAARAARSGAIEIDAPEPQIELDADGEVRSIQTRVQTESHRLIEHLMIAANEAVAELLRKRGSPCLYRVHERPRPERVALLAAQLTALGVPTAPVREQMSPSEASELVGELARGVQAHLRGGQARGHARGVRPGGRLALTSLVLRCLQQAYYSPRNVGHAGLGSSCYCHFTSPIRRYPDIVCHRALLAALGEGEREPRASGLVALGEACSAGEREAMSIERDADDIARCFALERLLFEQGFDQVFAGEVSGLIGAGAFVAFDVLEDERERRAGGEDPRRDEPSRDEPSVEQPRYEGMLPVRRMRGDGGQRDWWQLDELGTALHAERSRTTVRLGDTQLVRVSRVDTIRGRVDLAPAG
ncbi:MAG: RNB domain-containing ribonuclease, partial [Solirubrobacteraceae bacterium]